MHLFSCSNSKVQLFSNSYFSELGLFLLLFSCCVLLLCMISFGSLGRPSAQIVFLVTHFISRISLLSVFSADSLFISLKIDFSHIVGQRELIVGYHGLKLCVQN